MTDKSKPRAKPEFMADILDNGSIARRMREIAEKEGRPTPLQSNAAKPSSEY